MNQIAVDVVGLTKRFGDFTAVDGATFQIQRGEIFGFLGPNGAGKTTTIRMLLGLLVITGGQATIMGCDVARQTEAMRQRIGYMSQRFSLYEDLTVKENLDFYGHTYGVLGRRLRRRKDFVLAMAGLGARQHELTRNLAGGWKQRLALGTAILHEPEVLFLDEPTAGVDPISRRAFWDLLYDLADGGTTIFVTTHYMDEAEHCQDLAFIHRGRIIAQGSPEEIKATTMRGDVLEIDCEQPGRALALLKDEEHFDEVALYGALIHVVGPDVAARLGDIRWTLKTAGIHITAMDLIAPSLEDVFIANVRAHTHAASQSPQATKAEAEENAQHL
jgi:ABC-2 type transport system ATP-binding protein